MMKSAIGSYEWSEATDGILNRVERLQLLKMLIRSQAEEFFDRMLRRTNLFGLRVQQISFEAVRLPDSPTARQAEQEADEHYEPGLLLHCYRTYYWGALLGQAWNLKFDPELLYVGSLLHDFGLTAVHCAKSESCGFAVVGAREAFRFARRCEWEIERCRRLYETISLHLNPHLSTKLSDPEAVLLKGGATLDVIGANRHLIPKRQRDEVHRSFPRHGFRSEILASMSDIKHPKNSHPDFLFKCGFAALAKQNPLDSEEIAEG